MDGSERLLDDRLTEALPTWSPDSAKIATGFESERELDVMKLLMQGHSNKEIARRLVISERTVQTHLSNIFAKMEVGSRTEAVLVALRDGWLPRNQM